MGMFNLPRTKRTTYCETASVKDDLNTESKVFKCYFFSFECVSFLLPITYFEFFFFCIVLLFFLQDEKAEGFVNISSYSIESAGEHKRK